MKKKSILVLGVTILISLSGFVVIYAINNNIIHSINVVGYGIVVDGDYAYISHNDGVEILNIENKKHPIKIGNVDIDDGAFGLEKIGDLLYIAGDSDGLIIANISNPRDLTICNEPKPGNSATNIKVQNNIAYLLYIGGNVEIINVTNPFSPVKIATISPSGAQQLRSLLVTDDLLYVADSGRGINIYNISEPSSPIFIKQMGNAGSISLFKHENLLFVGCYSSGVKLYDVTNGTSPIFKGSYQEPNGEFYGVWGNTSHCYVADLQNGILCLNIAADGKLSKGNNNSEPTPHSITSDGNNFYVADQNFRLLIFDQNLNCLYDGHKQSYWIPVWISMIPLGIILYTMIKSKKKKLTIEI